MLQRSVTALRSLLRFLHLRGLTATGAGRGGAATVVVAGRGCRAGWSRSSWRRCWPPATAQPAAGRRDYAILILLARLGLRAGEVAALRLDDIDWRAGEIWCRRQGRPARAAAAAGRCRRGDRRLPAARAAGRRRWTGACSCASARRTAA